tara:strand:+ start:192 stop:1211 length:1020 start_codon:yes stop_codon:yes gene_type:complete
MANVKINDLSATAVASTTSSHFFVMADGSTTTKFAALSAAIKTITTLGSAGAGVVKTFALGTLSQRDIVGGTGVTVTQNTNDLTLAVTPGDINISSLTGIGSFDLNTCSNSSSAFLSSVNLATNVTGQLPIANGGTGVASFTNKGLLIGGASLSYAVLDANLEIAVGTTSGPEMKTLTAGASIAIAQDNSANTVTVGFTKGNFVEANDNVTLGNVTLGDVTAGDVTVGKFKTSTVGAVTQLTSLTTDVTMNAAAGVVTLHTDVFTTMSQKTFTITNSFVTADSVVMLTLLTPQVAGTNIEGGIYTNLLSVSSGQIEVTLVNDGTERASSTRKLHVVVIN